MIRDDAEKLKKALAAVFELHRRELTRPIFTIWFESLKFYDIDVVTAAISRHLVNPDNGQFLPVPADIVKLIEGGSDDVALLAWAKVDRAVRQVGPYASVVFDDAIIHHAITAIGGWISLGSKSADEWPFVRNQFVTLYRGARMRSFEFPSRLVGIAESHNAVVHRGIAQPTFIGDRDRAKAVMLRGSDIAQEIQAQPVRELLPGTSIEGRAA